jgi:large subunit ribosomal protein LX
MWLIEMAEVKVFRVTGRITKPNFRTKFQREVRAVKAEDAVEEILKNLGSKHKVKRFYIKIEEVEEIPDGEVEVA